MTLRRVFEVLLIADLFSMAVRHTLDPDMWWHLKTGALIWHEGIPHQDVFSFTVRGHEWITHEWLSDLFMWGVYRLAGLPALSLVFAALAACAFWLVYRCCEGQPYLAGLVIILATFTAAPTFGARPQIFTILLAAAFVNLLERVRAGSLGRRSLLLLPLLTVAWANLHSGYMLGVALLVTYAVGEGLELLFSTRTNTAASWSDVRLWGCWQRPVSSSRCATLMAGTCGAFRLLHCAARPFRRTFRNGFRRISIVISTGRLRR